MNRPYGAVDVAANLKGAVPKTAVQKILVSLAEKGELVQKTYGKPSSYPPRLALTIECLYTCDTLCFNDFKTPHIYRENHILRSQPSQLGRHACRETGFPRE